MKKKYLGLVVIFAIIGFICVFAGVTYAVFNYRKEGKVDNVITSGKITFRYDEDSVNGINLTGALPMNDSEGSQLNKEGEYFDFTVSTQGTDQTVYYDIQIEKTEDSELDEDIIKVYLTEMIDGKEYPISSSINNGVIKTLADFGTDQAGDTSLMADFFVKGSEERERKYRLRIWIDKEADYSPLENEDGTYQEDENGNYIYPYNGKKFGVRINVKASVSSGMGDAAGIYCDYDTYCSAGHEIILPDGSTWMLIKNFSSSESDTITLLSKNYIDIYGNYSEIPSASTTNGVSIPEENTQTNIQTKLNNFLYNIKSKLSDENITVSLPSAELLGLNYFDKAYDDTYFLPSSKVGINSFYGNNFDFYYDNAYMLSDNVSNYSYWVINNYNLKVNWGYMSSNSTSISYPVWAFVKPVITVSSDYLAQSYDYKIGDAVTAKDGSKWHVIQDSLSSSNTVTLLSDYNLNSDGTYNTSCGLNVNGSAECSPMAFDADNTVTYDVNDTNNIGYFIKNVYEPLVTTALPGTTSIMIPTGSELPNSSDHMWQFTTNYWTTSLSTDDCLSFVEGTLSYTMGDQCAGGGASDSVGARPVITTLKSNLN